MCIDGLSPLQNWLERIQNYLKKNELFKARISTLILPIFEAMEFLNCMKKICFRLSVPGEERLSDSLVKASFLAYNIFFSAYHGFKYPHRIYEFHKQCGLLFDQKPPFLFEEIEHENKIDEIDEILSSTPEQQRIVEVDRTQINARESKAVEDNEQIKKSEPSHTASENSNYTSKKPAEVKDKTRDQAPSSMEKDSSNIQGSRLNKFIADLKFSPHKIKKNESFAYNSDEIRKESENIFSPVKSRRMKRSSCPSACRQLRFGTPSKEEKKEIDSSPLVPFSLTDLNSQDQSKPDLKQVLPVSTDQSSLSSPPNELKPILSLIQDMIPKTGSWKVKNQQILFRQSKAFHFDPDIIEVLYQAYSKGFFSYLTVDQTFILHQNLKVIDASLGTRKANQLNLLTITQAIQNKLISLWIDEDYQSFLFYNKFQQLTSRIILLIKSGEGLAKQNRARLFEEPVSHDLFELFEKWQTEKFFLQTKSPKKELTLTVYQAYDLLKIYLKELPEDLIQNWSVLKQASSKDEWFKIIDQMEPEDKEMINHLVKILHAAYVHIWAKKDLSGMLKVADCITSLICPPHKLEVYPDTQIAVPDFITLSEIILNGF
jgi:hypothetical protein